MADGLEEFISQWNLGTEAQELLAPMDAAIQAKVIQEFAPRDTSRDVNGIFMKFARGCEISDGGDQAPAFALTWNLGDEAQQVLNNLPRPLQQKVMAEFAPRDVSRSVDAIFIRFAQGIGKGNPRGGKGAVPFAMQNCAGKGSPYGMQPQQPMMMQLQQQHGLMQQQLGMMMQQQGSIPQVGFPGQNFQPQVAVGDLTLSEFIQRWNLGDGAQAVLYALEPAAQTRVMQQFAPRDVSRDVSNMFCKFAQGVAKSQERFPAAPGYPTADARAMGVQAPVFPQVQNFQNFQPPITAVQPADGTPQDQAEFIIRWNLGVEAQTMLSGFSEEVQERVMREFRPRDTSSDANNIFMKFARGVSISVETGQVHQGKGAAKSFANNAMPSAMPNAMFANRCGPY